MTGGYMQKHYDHTMVYRFPDKERMAACAKWLIERGAWFAAYPAGLQIETAAVMLARFDSELVRDKGGEQLP